MSEPIIFFFEYASPYSYLATRVIDDFAAGHGLAVRWRPVRLRDIWTKIGRPSLSDDTAKAKLSYIRHDAERCATLQGLSFVLPERFPPDATLARLAFYRFDRRDPALGQRFAHAVTGQFYGGGRDISTVGQLADVAQTLGIDQGDLEDAQDDADAARGLADANEAAARSGCFGVPWFDVAGEQFFGHDRLPYIDRWLAARTQDR